eukprot:973527-Pyramimonas_sp.AAC.1
MGSDGSHPMGGGCRKVADTFGTLLSQEGCHTVHGGMGNSQFRRCYVLLSDVMGWYGMWLEAS